MLGILAPKSRPLPIKPEENNCISSWQQQTFVLLKEDDVHTLKAFPQAKTLQIAGFVPHFMIYS